MQHSISKSLPILGHILQVNNDTDPTQLSISLINLYTGRVVGFTKILQIPHIDIVTFRSDKNIRFLIFNSRNGNQPSLIYYDQDTNTLEKIMTFNILASSNIKLRYSCSWTYQYYNEDEERMILIQSGWDKIKLSIIYLNNQQENNRVVSFKSYDKWNRINFFHRIKGDVHIVVLAQHLLLIDLIKEKKIQSYQYCKEDSCMSYFDEKKLILYTISSVYNVNLQNSSGNSNSNSNSGYEFSLQAFKLGLKSISRIFQIPCIREIKEFYGSQNCSFRVIQVKGVSLFVAL